MLKLDQKLYGYTLRDLIVVAELYRKKGIILEDMAEAFKKGYETAYEEFNEAMKQSLNNLMNETG